MVDFGETTILASDDSGNNGALVAQQAVLGVAGTLQTLSFYVTPGTSAGSMRLGCYTDGGTVPNALVAQTNAFAVIDGWNTNPVISPTPMTAGTYWLVYEYDTGTVGLKVVTNGSFADVAFSFAAMPSTFPGGAATGSLHWSFFGSVSVGSGTTDSSKLLGKSVLLGRSMLLASPRERSPRSRFRRRGALYVSTLDRP